jgi:hypothetical protein
MARAECIGAIAQCPPLVGLLVFPGAQQVTLSAPITPAPQPPIPIGFVVDPPPGVFSIVFVVPLLYLLENVPNAAINIPAGYLAFNDSPGTPDLRLLSAGLSGYGLSVDAAGAIFLDVGTVPNNTSSVWLFTINPPVVLPLPPP